MVANMLTSLPTDEVTRDIGALPAHEEWLRADTLRPWRLQRVLNKAMVQKIAKEFDPEQLKHLEVSRRDGADYLLDGQHRWVAIVEELGWGDQNVPCLVYEGLTDEQEAKIFYAQAPGMQRPLSALHGFYVLVKTGNAQARRIEATVERAELRIAYNGTAGTRTVVAVKALKDVAKMYGIDRLETTLRMLTRLVGPDPSAYTADFIQGFAQFLVRYEDEYDAANLVEKVRPIGIDGMKAKALAIRSSEGGAMSGGIGKALRFYYNTGKRARALGPWPEHFRPADVSARRSERIGATARGGA